MPKSPHGPRNWRLHSDPVENEERAIARHTPLSLLLDDPKVEVLSAENTKAPEVIIFRGLGWVSRGALCLHRNGPPRSLLHGRRLMLGHVESSPH